MRFGVVFPVPPLENRNPSREIGDDQSNCLMLFLRLMLNAAFSNSCMFVAAVVSCRPPPRP